MSRLRSILLIVNLKTLLIVVLSIVSTYVCTQYGLVADFPLTLIATAVVFPIVFSIGNAYKRREAALDEYGAIKANGRAIYFAARDWIPDSTEEQRQARLAECSRLLGDLLADCRALFSAPLKSIEQYEPPVYGRFSDLSIFVKEELRAQGLPSGECSRCNQYLSKMLIAFENVKHVYQYRTPRTLRAFSDLFIVLLPIVYGPFFAHEASEYASGLAYVLPALFALILVSLDNIQEHLENPFDQIGEDDVMINAEKYVRRLNGVSAASQLA